MHILLINKNPVVSRLLALCTRDNAVSLEEVSHFSMAERSDYAVVFVDADAQDVGLENALSLLTCDLKVLISYVSNDMQGFDVTVQKPFLPSQIIAILAEVKEKIEAAAAEKPFIFPLAKEETAKSSDDFAKSTEQRLVEEATHLLEMSETLEEEVLEVPLKEETPENEMLEDQPLSILDADEIEKIKTLLEMDEVSEVPDELLNEDEIEERKREVIKEQLIADGLEIVEENAMLEEIVEEFSFGEKEEETKQEKKTKKKSKKLKFTEENMEHIQDAVEMAMASMTNKQMKKLLKGKTVDISVKLEGQN